MMREQMMSMTNQLLSGQDRHQEQFEGIHQYFAELCQHTGKHVKQLAARIDRWEKLGPRG